MLPLCQAGNRLADYKAPGWHIIAVIIQLSMTKSRFALILLRLIIRLEEKDNISLYKLSNVYLAVVVAKIAFESKVVVDPFSCILLNQLCHKTL